MIAADMGRVPLFSGVPVILALALLCAFLPSNSMLLIGTGIVLTEFYGISLEAALAGGGILVIALLLYFSIAPHSAVPLILTMITMHLGIPAPAAVLFGLTGGPLSAVGIVFGVGIYYLVVIKNRYGGSLVASSTDAAEAIVQKMTSLIDAVISNKEMFLMAAALAVLMWTVWLIRRMSVRYAWILAAAAGIVLYTAVCLGGGSFLGVHQDLLLLAGDAAGAMITALLAQTFLFSLDYRRTENVRIEDDAYFYYVKAIPKKKILRKRRARRSERR